ncbi:MAG: hypothetical protein WC829_18190 [Hyphomicrobium sp.]|jgi:hypothetical protein
MSDPIDLRECATVADILSDGRDVVDGLQSVARRFEKNGLRGSRLFGMSTTAADTIARQRREIARQRREIGRLRERLSRLADAADRVGIKYFDTDTMCPMVETMQTETSRARTALSDTTREGNHG